MAKPIDWSWGKWIALNAVGITVMLLFSLAVLRLLR
jgi:hypothetical protein